MVVIAQTKTYSQYDNDFRYTFCWPKKATVLKRLLIWPNLSINKLFVAFMSKHSLQTLFRNSNLHIGFLQPSCRRNKIHVYAVLTIRPSWPHTKIYKTGLRTFDGYTWLKELQSYRHQIDNHMICLNSFGEQQTICLHLSLKSLFGV